MERIRSALGGNSLFVGHTALQAAPSLRRGKYFCSGGDGQRLKVPPATLNQTVLPCTELAIPWLQNRACDDGCLVAEMAQLGQKRLVSLVRLHNWAGDGSVPFGVGQTQNGSRWAEVTGGQCSSQRDCGILLAPKPTSVFALPQRGEHCGHSRADTKRDETRTVAQSSPLPRHSRNVR